MLVSRNNGRQISLQTSSAAQRSPQFYGWLGGFLKKRNREQLFGWKTPCCLFTPEHLLVTHDEDSEL